ncbi:MAG TPA: hypothetical protein VL172_22040 [Kofleriaceae bacterium]|nr:hypothetical protein [Kofleriaceae bacterium]
MTAARSIGVACLVLVACGGDDDRKGASRSAPPGTDAARMVTVVDAAPAPRPPDADPGPQMPPADREYADKSAWAMAWALAMNRPMAAAPANPDWPCAYDVDGRTSTYEYGGPAACLTPPDQIQIGCPTSSFVPDSSPQLNTTEEYAYDGAGHLVAMRRSNQMRIRRIVYTWDGDHLADMDSDSTDDGKPDEHWHYTYEGNTIKHEERYQDGTSKVLGIYTVAGGRVVAKVKPRSEIRYPMADGHVMVTPQPGNRIEYVWKDARLLEARGFAEHGKKPAEVGTYRYDCR